MEQLETKIKELYFVRLTGGIAGLDLRSAIFVRGETPLLSNSFSLSFSCEAFKRIVHPKIVITYSHPHVVQNLYEFLTSVEHKRRWSE